MDEDAVADADFELATRIACGEDEAMRDFIERHGGKIRGFLRKRFASVADDAFQKMMMKLIDHADQYDPAKSGLRSWGVRIAQTCALDLLRAEPPRPTGILHPDISVDYRHGTPSRGGRDAVPDPKEAKRRERRERLLREAIGTLSPTEQKVVAADLAHLSDGRQTDSVAPAAALAERIGTTIAAVHAARSRGRAKLRSELTGRGVYHAEGQP